MNLKPPSVPVVSASSEDGDHAPESLTRRHLAGILALFGGGAAAAACTGSDGLSSDPSTRQSVGEISGATLPNLPIIETIAAGLVGSPTAVGRTGTSDWEFVIASGYHTKGDGGGGLFMWNPYGAGSPLSESADGWDNGINLPPFVANGGGIARATVGYWMRIYTGPLDVKWFGAYGTGQPDNDDSTAIQNAIWRAGRTFSGEVYLPSGVYIVKNELLISNPNIHLRGAGMGATKFYYLRPGTSPTVATILTLKQRDASGISGYMAGNRLFGCSVRSLGFGSDSGSNGVKKTAIALLNTDSCVLEDILVSGWTTPETPYESVSIGIRVVSGQLNKIHRVSLATDRPISIEPPPSVGSGETLNCDHLHLSDLSLTARAGQANLAIAQNVFLSTFLIDGLNSFNNGQWGIRWTGECTTPVAHYNVSINNIRCEGITASTVTTYPADGYPDLGTAIYIAMTRSSVQALRIINVRGPGAPYTCNGVTVQNVTAGLIESCTFNSSAKPITVLDTHADVGSPSVRVDYTSQVECRNNFLNTAGALSGAVCVTKVRDILAAGASPYNLANVLPSAFYKRCTVTVTVSESSGTTTVSEAGVWLLTRSGLTSLYMTNNFVMTNTTGKLSLEWSSGGSTFVLRNNLAVAIDFTIQFDHST